MEFNLFSLTYLIFRLAPFMVASFFSIASLFNSDIKGIIYLVGLIFACGVSILLGNAGAAMSPTSFTPPAESLQICKLLSIGGNYSVSKVPLSLVVFSYTMFYLVYAIAMNNLETTNIPTLVIFPTVILADLWWNLSSNCFTLMACIAAIIFAGAVGVGWSALVYQKMPTAHYIMTGSSREYCYAPSKQNYVCKFIKK